MKRKILIADRDESLQHAFSIVLPKERYEILYASNGKEVERLAEHVSPDIYVVNVNLPKMNGIELYKKLQRDRYLDDATFFFLKDEHDTTQLLGYQAAGVIEKPINFFRVYETITREDDVIDLTDVVEEETDTSKAAVVGNPIEDLISSLSRARESTEPAQSEPPVAPEGYRARQPEMQTPPAPTAREPRADLGERLRDAVGPLVNEAAGETEGGGSLEERIRTAMNEVLKEASEKLAARLAPEIAAYVEESVQRILLEVAERVIREEIDKLLKESAT